MNESKNKSNVYVCESGDLIYIGNDLIELGFNQAKKGALVSILDKQTGYQFQRNPSSPMALYRLALRREDNREMEWLDSNNAAGFQWDREKEGESVILTLMSFHFSHRDMKVIVKVSLTNGSSLTLWRMEIRDVEKEAVFQLTCPIITGLFKIGCPVSGESIVFPRQGEGYVFKNPYPVCDNLPLCAGAGPDMPDVGIGELHGLYPGNIPMQFFAYYNEQAGLYLATHDARENVKSYDVAPVTDWGQFPVFSISHFPDEEIDTDVSFSYDTVLGVFHGDWYDCADIYKAWATKQWWCEKKLWQRDIPHWMHTGFGVFQMSNYHMPTIKINHSLSQIADVVNKISEETGVPLLALVFNWEHDGAWTGPVGFFPPREGEDKFKDAMARLRKAGNYGFVYITGGCWYLKLPYEPPFDSYEEFKVEGRASAIIDARGEISGLGPQATGWESTRLCPHVEYTKRLTASILLKCIGLGCTVVQIDNFPCGGSEECYNSSHGHPLGHGTWWSQAWGKILADIRHRARAKNQNFAITTEGISENFIQYVDMYDHRGGNMEYWGGDHYKRGDPMDGEVIPLFGYVYHEYIGAYSAAMPECNRPEVLYWTRCLGKSLVQGVVPNGGKYFPEPTELNPITFGFYKKLSVPQLRNAGRI